MDLYKSWELWLKTLTLVGAIIAAIWTAATYFDSKEKEFYTEFWNQKMALFQQASNAASTLAVTTNLDEFNSARSKFWKLFYGELSLVEGQCVKHAMQVFSQCVPKTKIDDASLLPFRDLEQPSYRLSIRLQAELAGAWVEPFSELQLEKTPKNCPFPKEKICLTSSSN